MSISQALPVTSSERSSPEENGAPLTGAPLVPGTIPGTHIRDKSLHSTTVISVA